MIPQQPIQSQQQINPPLPPSSNIRKSQLPPEIDIIQQTKRNVSGKSQTQRYKIARHHLFNALDFKTARLDIHQPGVSKYLKFAYNLQTYFLWRRFLLLIAYLFMYSSFFGHVHPSNALIIVEFCFLFFMIVDLVLEIYHKKFNILRPSSRFQPRFYVRLITVILLVADEIIVLSTQSLPVRPFLILRCIPPVIYDHNMRKMVYALFASYIDIFVYALFYMSVIITFAIMANQFVQIPPSETYDEFTGAYGQLGKAIFIMYVLTTFDAYPDNQLVAIRITIWIYAFFILFIFLNALFFVTIPTNILLNSIKETRSKTVIIDQIQQQHSLIMAFVTLGGDSNMVISYDKVIRFLLFVFNNQVKYLDKITQICMQMDQKVNGTIQVNEFMQLCKIIQSKNYLRPPRWNTWKKLNHFQSFIHNKLKLRQIILSKQFQAANAIFILVTFVNCILTMYLYAEVFDIIDDILMLVYIVQIVFKMIGLGPQQFFQSYWNSIDLVIIIVGLFLQVAPAQIIPNNADVIIKMFRIFRITLLIGLIAEWCGLSYKSMVYVKLTELINQIALIIPIVLKFFPLYMLSFYFLGVLGCQIFWYVTDITPQNSPYSNYNEFSNFQTLLGAQFIFVQVLTEAGWSAVAYDHAYRYGTFAMTMLFFVLCHEVIVIILTSLLKGVTWEVYNSIHDEHEDHKTKRIQEESENKKLEKRLQIFAETKKRIDVHQNILPDNLVTRELYEKKIDGEIMKRLIEVQMKNKNIFFHKGRASKNYVQTSKNIVNRGQRYQSILLADIEGSAERIARPTQSRLIHQYQPQNNNKFLQVPPPRKGSHQKEHHKKRRPTLYDQDNNSSDRELNDSHQESRTSISVSIQDLKQEDIQKQIDDVLQDVQIHKDIKFSVKIEHPPSYVQYLKAKMKPIRVNNYTRNFDIDKDIFARRDSMSLLVHGLHTLLELQTSERQQKAFILDAMVKKGLISQQKAKKMVTQKSELSNQLTFDYNWVIRKTYLSNINQAKINQFQMQYFSGVYGRSFKQINKVTIYPLIRLEARLTYCFTNLLRYREITTQQFFNTLTHIQNKISVKLLQSGSICKFVYQIDTNSETWFTVQLKDSNQLRVHFIKNGLWLTHENSKKDQIYAAEDIFYWKKLSENDQQGSHKIQETRKYVKRLFQSFQSLAFTINDYDTFFNPETTFQSYDLYTFYRDVETTKRYMKKQLSISKIMMVILSKGQQRQQQIPYSLSDIKYQPEQISKYNKRKQFFRLDQTQNQIFQKLKTFQLQDQQLISDRQKLPYSYIVNFMMHIRQIMILSQRNFVFHAEKLLNREFREVEKHNLSPKLKRRTSLIQDIL